MNQSIPTSDAASRPLAIVVGLAFTEADGPAFDQAARVAQRVPRSELHLVHVFDETPSPERARDLVAHLRLYVNEKAAMAGGLRGVTVGIHLRAGKPVRELVQLASDVVADLIVVGSRGGAHLKSWIVGSTMEKLIGVAPCPVIVAGPPPKPVEHEPPVTIDPPCPDCLRAREASGGAQWWCERHSHRVASGHVFSYQRELPLATHDSAVIPTGIGF